MVTPVIDDTSILPYFICFIYRMIISLMKVDPLLIELMDVAPDVDCDDDENVPLVLQLTIDMLSVVCYSQNTVNNQPKVFMPITIKMRHILFVIMKLLIKYYTFVCISRQRSMAF